MHRFSPFTDWLFGKHLTKDLSPREARAFRVINSLLIYIIISVPAMFLTLAFGTFPENAVEFTAITNTILALGSISFWVLLRRGYRTSAAVLTCLILNSALATFSFAIPGEGTYYAVPVLLMLPFLIISDTRPLLRNSLAILPAVWFVIHQIVFRVLGYETFFGPQLWVAAADRVIPSLALSMILLFLVVQVFVNQVDIAEKNLKQEHARSEGLLLNILPGSIAQELKDGFREPRYFEAVTVCFTDFVGFTKIAQSMSPSQLVDELDQCFSRFDGVMTRYNLEKLKTLGDGYLFVGGLPKTNNTHAIDTVLAAMEIQNFMSQLIQTRVGQGLPYWEIRLGIHTGDVVAGVIGEKKFAYDIWGDTVNTASRCESAGIPGRINISKVTYEKVKDFFDCEYRGAIPMKNRGEMEMYFVNGLLPEFRDSTNTGVPNQKFRDLYAQL